MDFPSEITVRLVPSDELLHLRKRVEEFETEAVALRRCDASEYKYRCEVLVNAQLLDLCKAHGLDIPASLRQRPRLPSP